jgi:hypothetical protein
MASAAQDVSPKRDSPRSPRLRTPGYATSIKGRSKMESVKEKSHKRRSARLSVGRKFYNIEKRCVRIKRCIEHATLLKEGINFNYIVQQSDTSHNLQVDLRMDRGTQNLAFCSTIYYKNGNNTSAKILNVESTVGHSTGSFLVNIQLLICFLSGVYEITLENCTDDDVRATYGIYKQFVVEKRGYPRSAFQGKSLKDQLHTVCGQMRLKMHSEVKEVTSKALRDISKKVDTPQSHDNPWRPTPWNEHYDDNINKFLTCLGSFHGGSRRKQSTRKKRILNIKS